MMMNQIGMRNKVLIWAKKQESRRPTSKLKEIKSTFSSLQKPLQTYE